MPRQARCYNEGEYFHVMVRGNNKQNIFLDDEDRQRFLDTMRRFSSETGADILAWCLMSNHVHLLLKAEKMPDQFMKKLGCSYVPYFNRKYGRIGHLFQDRYKCETIRDDKYMLAVIRYIHMNPEKAHICRMSEYKWSSYSEYLEKGKKADRDLILGMLGGVEGYQRFMETPDTGAFMEDGNRLTEQEAVDKFSELFPAGASAIQGLPRDERIRAVIKLSEAGLTAAQICRITGMGKNIVYRALK